MAALVLPSRCTQQPQRGAKVRSDIRADFAWVPSAGALVGPRVNPGTAVPRNTKEGVAISGGYAVVSAPIPSLHTTTWTEIGTVLLDGSSNVHMLSARDEGQTVLMQPGGSTVNLIIWGIANVNVSGVALPVGLVHYVARRDGSAHTVWINGRLYGTASNANSPVASSGILPAIGAQAASGGNVGSGALTASSGILSVVRTSRALSDAQCLELSANPWAAFEAQQQMLWPASSTGSIDLAATLSSTASVSATLSTNISLASSMAAGAAVSANLATGISLSASASASASSSAALSTAKPLAATPAASASVSAELSTSIALQVAAAAQPSSTGELTTKIALAAAMQSSASLNASFDGTSAALSCNAVSSSTASAALSTAISLTSSTGAIASAAGTLTTSIRLSCSATSTSSASGMLFGGDLPIVPSQILLVVAENRILTAFAENRILEL